MKPKALSISLTFKKTADAIAFYKSAFGAEESFRMDVPGGGVAHAEMSIGEVHLYMSDESPEWGAFAMPEGTTASCVFTFAVDDCDAAHRKAVDAGATSISEPQNQFWGSRSSVVRDPFGYRWSFNQVIEELSNEEIMRRTQEMMGG